MQLQLSVVSANPSTVLDPDVTTGHGSAGPNIRCPLCAWTPAKGDLWSCACHHLWHTFDTGGVCPACLQQWTSTQCLSCAGWSAHSAWYRYL